MKKMIYSLVCLQAVFFSSGLFAEGEVEALPPRDGSFWQTIVMIGIAILFGYFIIWRPEQKRRKTMETQRSALKKGDRVTAMGIIGTVVRIQEHTIILRMYDGSKIEFVKAAITDVMPGTDEEAKKIDKEEKGSNSGKRIELSEIDTHSKE